MEQHTGSYGESTQSRFENLPPSFKSMQGKKKVKKTRKLPTFCVFCKNNNESESVYTSHVLKDPDNKVVCPALYIYKCPICNNTGHDAHTVKHCPYNPEQLRRQTELAEIWRSYRETKEDRPEDFTQNQYQQHPFQSPYKGSPAEVDYRYSSPNYQRPQPLASSSLYNIHANTNKQSFSTSFRSVSVSPSSSCTSPLLSPNRSLFSSFPSPPISPSFNHIPAPPMTPRNIKQNRPDENSIVMENLWKLLQVTN